MTRHQTLVVWSRCFILKLFLAKILVSTVSLSAAASCSNAHIICSQRANANAHLCQTLNRIISRKPPTSRPSSRYTALCFYDFIAKRSDELQAKAGESIIIFPSQITNGLLQNPLDGSAVLASSLFLLSEVRSITTNQPVDNLEDANSAGGRAARGEEWK